MKTIQSFLITIFVLVIYIGQTRAQEVEVKLGGNSTTDAFVVRNNSNDEMLRIDGSGNFGINSAEPNGIELTEIGGGNFKIQNSIEINAGQNGNIIMRGGFDSGSITLEGGAFGGDINLQAGYEGGNINIYSGSAASQSGDVNISTSGSNNYGGKMRLSTGFCNSGGNTLTISTGEATGGQNRILLQTGEVLSTGDNQIVLKSGVMDTTFGSFLTGIVLDPNYGIVSVLGSGTYTGTWTQASDERYKNNIKPLLGILNKVNLLRPVEYEWNKEEYPENNFPEGNQIGLIAQEVEKLFPEIVKTNRDGYKSIDYSKISVVLLQAVKEQQELIDKHSEELKKLNSEVEELKRLLEEEYDVALKDK